MTWLARLLATGLVTLWVLAVVAQDFTDRLPLGLFNEDRDSYRLLSVGLLALGATALCALLSELALGRLGGLAGIVRRLLFSLLLLELVLRAFDPWIASGPRSPFGGPYTERRASTGEWVYVAKEHRGSKLGFRTDRPYELKPQRPRLLFLGDSYTKGSGRGSACNYPNVVEKTLAERFGFEVEAMNAGVAGYGPRDVFGLLQLLRDEGYRFDGIVFTLSLENDFTDDLPGTVRRVVGGINFRFPEEDWLRNAHPLNSFSFRYLILFRELGFELRGARDAAMLDKGPCRLAPVPTREPSPFLRQLVRDRLAGSERVLGSPQTIDESLSALERLAGESVRLGVPFFVVVFPDRVLVDEELRRRLSISDGEIARLARLRALVLERIEAPIDVSPVLESATGLYRAKDTHLSDLGNVVAGRFVAEQLSSRLAATGFRTSTTDSPGP